MNVEAKKIALIEKIISVKNEKLIDAFLSVISKNEAQEQNASTYSISKENLEKMACLAESDFEQKKYTLAADLLHEMDSW